MAWDAASSLASCPFSSSAESATAFERVSSSLTALAVASSAAWRATVSFSWIFLASACACAARCATDCASTSAFSAATSRRTSIPSRCASIASTLRCACLSSASASFLARLRMMSASASALRRAICSAVASASSNLSALASVEPLALALTATQACSRWAMTASRLVRLCSASRTREISVCACLAASRAISCISSRVRLYDASSVCICRIWPPSARFSSSADSAASAVTLAIMLAPREERFCLAAAPP